MIVTSPRQIDYARAQPTSQRQQHDSLLVIPPTLQPVCEFPHISRAPGYLQVGAVGLNVTLNDSFYVSNLIPQAGVSAGQTFNWPKMKAGIWHVKGSIATYYIGAAPNNAIDQLQLTEPLGVNAGVISRTGHRLANTYDVVYFDHTWAFDQDGWFMQQITGATLAGDILTYIGAASFHRLG